jgi:hypothetical protein
MDLREDHCAQHVSESTLKEHKEASRRHFWGSKKKPHPATRLGTSGAQSLLTCCTSLSPFEIFSV